VVLSKDGFAYELLGTAGSFVPGARLASEVRAFASSGQVVALKFDTVLRVNGAEFDVPTGSAVLGFDAGGATVYAYFPADQSLARVSNGALEWLPVDASRFGDVIALTADTSLVLYTRLDGRLHHIRMRLSDGAVESDTMLEAEAGNAIAIPGIGPLIARGSQLILGDTSVDVGAPVQSLALMNRDWVQVRAGDRNLAVRLRDLAVYFTPEVSQ